MSGKHRRGDGQLYVGTVAYSVFGVGTVAYSVFGWERLDEHGHWELVVEPKRCCHGNLKDECTVGYGGDT